LNENLRSKAGLIYNVVEAVVLAMSIMLVCWTAKTVIEQGKVQSTHTAQIATNTGRLDGLESHGSRGLEAHAGLDNQWHTDNERRLEKLEANMAVLQQSMGKLESMSVRLEGLVEGQSRIERQLEDKKKL
jgi:hypothetical protein